MQKKINFAFAFVLLGMLWIMFGYQDAFRVIKNSGISSEEIAQTLNIKWWRFKIPDNREKHSLGFAFKTSKGIRLFSTSSCWRAGETVKVVICNLNENRVRYSIIGSSFKISASIPNLVKDSSQLLVQCSKNGSLVEEGEYLLRSSSANTVAAGKKLNDSETALVLAFEGPGVTLDNEVDR